MRLPSMSLRLIEMIDPRRVGLHRGRIAVEDRVLAGARHVDGQCRQARAEQERDLRLPVFLPAVDAAPMDDDRRPRHALRDRQVAGELAFLERDLDDLQRIVEMPRRLAEHAHGIEIGLLLARRVGDRIAADAAIVGREVVDVGKLLGAGAFRGQCIALRLVVEPDLAPGLRPVIAIEAGQRRDDALRVGRTDMVERIDLAGAAQDFLLDVVERAHSVSAPVGSLVVSTMAAPIAHARNRRVNMIPPRCLKPQRSPPAPRP